MSYQITATKVLIMSAQMFAKDVRELLIELKGDGRPECSFFDEMKVDGVPDTTPISLPNFWWYGEGSGNSYETLKLKIAPRIIGHIQVVFIWEGGDSFSGLDINDGKVTECEVELSLKPIAK